MKKKIGVYICHCGGNISDYVDVEQVRRAIEEEGVEMVKTTMFACADSSQKEMVADIKERNLDGMVVASCSPKLHLLTFRAVAERAGLNKYNYVHANIREQVSWPHSDDREGATQKAIRTVKAAIARVRYAGSPETIRIPAVRAVAVIGAGVAGMRAALELSKMGCQVFLIENAPYTGGRTSQWDVLFTSEESGESLTTRLYHELRQRGNVNIFTNTEVIAASGSIGNFTLQIRVRPYYAGLNGDSENLSAAIKACPVETGDPFNFNLTSRKALYLPFPGEHPQKPVIDMRYCTRCGECGKICRDIDLSRQEETLSLTVGSVVVATGFDPLHTSKRGIRISKGREHHDSSGIQAPGGRQ